MNIDEVNLNEQINFYNPNDKPAQLVTGQLYLAHITDVKIAEVRVRNKYKAKVYNCWVALAKENAGNMVTDANGKEIVSCKFAGRKIKSKGVFMFLNPQEGDDFEANNGANEQFLRFAECIGHEPKTIEVDIDGVKTEVLQFPNLTEGDITNKPIKVYVDKAPYRDKEGNQKEGLIVKGWDKWSDGKSLDEEVPF